MASYRPLKDHSSRNTYEFVEAFLPSLLSCRAGQQLTAEHKWRDYKTLQLFSTNPPLHTDPHRRSSSVNEGAVRCICGNHDMTLRRFGWIRAHMCVFVCVCVFALVCVHGIYCMHTALGWMGWIRATFGSFSQQRPKHSLFSSCPSLSGFHQVKTFWTAASSNAKMSRAEKRELSI